jgi:Flp pilus assembly protein TadG
MRRLTLVRLRDDSGAVAVIVALAMAALLAGAALAVDIGSMLSLRAQLQNGADAAAIAVAQACAANSTAPSCTAPTTTPRALAAANTLSGNGTVRSVRVSGTTATVTTAATIPLAFAATFGMAHGTASASATASWGTPIKGPSVLPIAFSVCSFTSKPVGTAMDMLQHSIGDATGSCRNSVNGMTLPGGFGWLNQTSGCGLTITALQSLAASSDSGTSASSACSALLPTLLNTTVILPVFDSTTGTGTNGTFHIAGWAEFQLLGWRFPAASPVSQNVSGDPTLSIQPPASGLIGKFLGYVTLDKRFTLGPPTSPYASIVALTG